jgi:hypothetical protein
MSFKYFQGAQRIQREALLHEIFHDVRSRVHLPAPAPEIDSSDDESSNDATDDYYTGIAHQELSYYESSAQRFGHCSVLKHYRITYGL